MSEKKPTQHEKIMKALEDARDGILKSEFVKEGGWVNKQYFSRVLWLTKSDARVSELRQKGIEIEYSDFHDEFGFKSYRLKKKETLF